jgi:hypothetical protein
MTTKPQKIEGGKEGKKKIIEWGQGHILQCPTCFEMERRGYESEDKYWEHDFDGKLKPIKYRMIKGWGKDKGLEITEPR